MRVQGAGLPSGSIALSGAVSSQYLTALLMAAPLAKRNCDDVDAQEQGNEVCGCTAETALRRAVEALPPAVTQCGCQAENLIGTASTGSQCFTVLHRVHRAWMLFVQV